MRFKIISGIFSIILFLNFSSCMYEDTIGVKIDFTKVIGQYSGNSSICAIMPPSPDSICTPIFPNNLKIILFDLNTIIITDEKKLFQQNRLTYAGTNTKSNKNVYTFISADTTTITLTYDEFLKNIKVVSHEISADKKISKSFSGFKK